MRKTVSAIVIAGTVCSVALFAVMNTDVSSASTSLFMKDNSKEVEFHKFITKYRRSYGTKEEYQFRMKLFLENLEKIEAHNNLGDQLTLGVNHFSDYTQEEIKQMLGHRPSNKTKNYTDKVETPVTLAAIDWRAKGAVNAVKDQGQCGSCWAFSAASTMESAHYIKTGQLLSLSEQQFVDCSGAYGNYGCNGGLYDNAFDYAYYSKIETEGNYPYRGTDGSCRYQPSLGQVLATTYDNVYPNNLSSFYSYLQQGPVNVAVQANQYYFMNYAGGILTLANCPGRQLDHAIVAVGYGESAGMQYLIVRNSWSARWGESGYVRMQVTSNNGACGVLSEPTLVYTN